MKKTLYSPLMSISHIQNCYQLLQTAQNCYQLLQTAHGDPGSRLVFNWACAATLLMTVRVWLVSVDRHKAQVQYLVQRVDSIFCQADGNAPEVRVWLSDGARIQKGWNQEDSTLQEYARAIHSAICDRGQVATDGTLWPGGCTETRLARSQWRVYDVAFTVAWREWTKWWMRVGISPGGGNRDQRMSPGPGVPLRLSGAYSQ